MLTLVVKSGLVLRIGWLAWAGFLDRKMCLTFKAHTQT